MLQPKRVKWRKPHLPSYEGKPKGNTYIAFGEMGLVAEEGAWISSRQIESARIAISKHLGKTGKMWIRIFPHQGRTKKPLEVRMGSGKGGIEDYVAVVKQGTIMFEIGGVDKKEMKTGLTRAMHKLPIKCKLISREVAA
jgi:large subunit ribosomal protein L16